MKYYKRIVLIFIDIILTTFLYPIMGRSVVLFSVPFIISLVLLTKFSFPKTRKIVLYFELFVAVLWGISYTMSASLFVGIVVAITALFFGIVGIFSALFINRLL